MASIRDLDSFMGSYSVPSFLKEEPTNFAKALSDWQQVQNNYYKNDKAREELEDREEAREKNKEREKKMLELGLTLDPDDLRGSLRKVIDFSNGEGDINTSLSIMGRLYQMDQADKREREAAARKALGITKKEQTKLEKAAKKQKALEYIRQGTNIYGFTPEAYRYAAGLAAENNDPDSISEIGNSAKTFSSLWSKEKKDEDDEVGKIMNYSNQNSNQSTGAKYEGQRATGHKIGSVVRFDDGRVYKVGSDGNFSLLK